MSFANFCPESLVYLIQKKGKEIRETLDKSNDVSIFPNQSLIGYTKSEVMHTYIDIHGDAIFHFIAQDKSRLGSGGKIWRSTFLTMG